MSDATPETILPGPQIRAAYALAHAHGHGWAWALYNLGLSPEGMSLGEIRAATERWHEIDCFPHPIYRPEVVGGAVVHRTGTGRLRWEIAPDGATTLILSRPEGQAATIRVSPDGYVRVDHQAQEVPMYTRHLEPALQAVAALVRAACGV